MESSNALFGLTGYFYTPVWGYILGTINTLIESFCGLDLFGIRFTDLLGIEALNHIYYTATTTTPLFNLAMKLPLILCDVLVGYLIWQLIIEKTDDQKKATAGFSLWFLCPLVIYMSGIQVQFDCISALMALLSVILLKKDHYFLAGIMFALGTLIKLFPAFLVLLFVIYLLRVHKNDGQAFRKIGWAALGTVLTVGIIFLPQILDGTLSNAFSFITDRASETSEITNRLVTYFFAAVGLVIMTYVAWRMNKLDAHQARDKLYKYALATLAGTGLIAIGPQYCIVFLPLLIYYATAEDRGYRLCVYIIGIGGLGAALANNSVSLLTSAGEFWGLWSAADILSWMQAFETEIGGVTVAAWTIALFTVMESFGILLVSCFLWAELPHTGRFLRLQKLILQLKKLQP
ncbi:MAG: glycosyltransferase 87 family protein [Sphaerochaetaceae bacterium]